MPSIDVSFNIRSLLVSKPDDAIDVTVVFEVGSSPNSFEIRYQVHRAQSLDAAVEEARKYVVALAQGLARAAERPFFQVQ